MTLTLNNGTVVPITGCGTTGKELHVDLPAEYGFVRTVQTFDDKEATEKMTYESSAETIVYEDYTQLIRVGYSPWKAETLNVVLEKGE